MQAFGNIVVFHPAAIGDAMLASPVAAALKLNYPAARLTYWTHPGLKEMLLGLCPAIDEVVDYDRSASIFQLIKTYKQLKPDLFVDLSNSNKGRLITMARRTKVLRYVKQPSTGTNADTLHATDNFLATVLPVCPELSDKLFPTLFPNALVNEVMAKVFSGTNLQQLPMIALVPGVGQMRPHRAWLYDGWLYLIRQLLDWRNYLPVLIGGPAESELCRGINEEVDGACLNVAGSLTLSETAALLSCCEVVVSGDTGPAHIAVAVGTPVIGLYGPTFPQRSGPYGCLDLIIDQSAHCSCHELKSCRLARPDAPGECMHRIMLAEIIANLKEVLQISDS